MKSPNGRPQSKQEEWEGYYDGYLRQASDAGVSALDILDRQWHDGAATARRDVLPHLTPESVVLEIACGIGRVSRHVASHCKRLHCTDITEQALEECRKNLSRFDNVEFSKTDGYGLASFSDSSFDCVFSFTAFFHLDFELVVVYLGEIERVLKPGGVAIIEFKRWIDEQDVANLLSKIERVGGIRAYEAHLSKWHYVSADMLRLLCRHYELEIVDDDVTAFTVRKPGVREETQETRRGPP